MKLFNDERRFPNPRPQRGNWTYTAANNCTAPWLIHVYEMPDEKGEIGAYRDIIGMVFAEDEETNDIYTTLRNTIRFSRRDTGRDRDNLVSAISRYYGGWFWGITPNPAGPFAYGVFYGAGQSRRLSKVFGLWDEAVECVDYRVREFTRLDDRERFFEIRKFPILGTRTGCISGWTRGSRGSCGVTGVGCMK